MEAKPPLRQRSWYSVVWWVLFIVSGLWTLRCAYLGSQLILHPPVTEEQGFGALGCEVLLGISIPVYCLFIVLLFIFPRRGSKDP
jgi:hypothetical protein